MERYCYNNGKGIYAMFRLVICDDNMTDLEILRNGTEQWIKNTAGISGTVSTFRNSKELQEYIVENKSRFDLYLLDVMMSQPDGILLGRLIRQYDTEVSIIYVTSSSEYALEAYGIHAIRYLMKPLNMEELHSALNLSYALFRMRPRHTLLVNTSDSVTSIIMEEIMYIENDLRNMTYTMCDGNTVTSVRRGGSFEHAVGSVASDSNFIQPHKSFFVNIRYIHALQSDAILMDDGRKIPIARRRLAEIQERYISFVSRGKIND